MYGWRARVGSISATPTDVFPYEFYLMAPEGVSLLQTTLFIHDVTTEAVLENEKLFDNIAQQLARKRVNVIILGASPTVYLHGPGYEDELTDRIAQKTGIKTISNQAAAVEALQVLGLQKLVVASPNTDDLLVNLKVYLESYGLQVLSIRGLQVRDNVGMGLFPQYRSYQWAREVFTEAPGAEGIYIPCAGWPVAPNIQLLEDDLGVSVVSSNQAKVWAALRAAGIREQIPGYGRLLREF